jgi:hypothetical protein
MFAQVERIGNNPGPVHSPKIGELEPELQVITRGKLWEQRNASFASI